MAALITFRQEYFEITKRPAGPDGKADRACYSTPHNGIDVLRNCITIAGACMRHFRTNHLKPGHVAIVPEKGYDNADNQSQLALKYLQWYSEKHGVEIQAAHSAEGEKRYLGLKIYNFFYKILMEIFKSWKLSPRWVD